MNYEKLLTSKQKLYLKNLYFTIKLRILNTVREQIKTDKKVDLNVLETELVLDNIKYIYYVYLLLSILTYAITSFWTQNININLTNSKCTIKLLI